ncbi:hypothetical protein PV390_29940 [Streptomyces sp. ME02-6991-2A]|uniref:hypothetical protein n=1 Tax=Streptomyces sp. ME02-6991-2A TaxID=3028677 RepID=UPI0010083D68|nr:hypothetical protein [Streptomyces sp. ME02-6991-2A]MDX3378625.1 hypothetical protein [Streptomyces sp. ME02-6991-2A]
MTQTPNETGNTGNTPDRPAPSTGAERVPPVTPPGNALGTPVPPTAAKPSGSPPTATGTDGTAAPAAGRAHADKTLADSARTDKARETGRTTASSHAHSHGTDTDTAKDNGRPLFAAETREKFDARIHQAVAGFVENPRQAVQEADAAFDEVVTELTQALAERSRLLRTDRDGERSEAGTEDLRIALQQYRDLTERLVRL